jgi:hypothetical protein
VLGARDCERLAEEVIGAGIETLDAQGDLRERGEQQDRHRGAVRAKLSAQLEAEPVWQAQVEHDEVGPFCDTLTRRLEVLGGRDGVAVGPQGPRHDAPYLRFIIDDQYPHLLPHLTGT